MRLPRCDAVPGFTFAHGTIPYETTIPNFRHSLQKHSLAERTLRPVVELPVRNGLMLKLGTIVDVTIIPASRSTKNSAGERDPEMHQTKQRNQGHFGMKPHAAAQSIWNSPPRATFTSHTLTAVPSTVSTSPDSASEPTRRARGPAPLTRLGRMNADVAMTSKLPTGHAANIYPARRDS